MGTERRETAPDHAPFQDVDWDDGGSRFGMSIQTKSFVALGAGLALFYLFDVSIQAGQDTFAFWDVSRLDWLTMLAAVFLLAFLVVPVARNPHRLRAFWADYPKDPLSVLAFGFVLVLGAVGVFGPLVLSKPEVTITRAGQPPAFTAIPAKYVVNCLGPLVEDACHGTLAYPLGTTRGGERVLVWLVYGARTAIQFAVLSTVIMAPIAVAAGTTTAFYGGRVDALATRILELQEAVPTFIVYFLCVMFVGPTLFVLVAVYGLFNWSGMALAIRQAARSEKQEDYVRAAESAGAGPLTIVRRHLVPNVSETVVTQVSLLIPKLILIEALFSYLGLSGDQSFSWGQLIQRGLKWQGPSQLEGLWWIGTLPAVAILVTVVACNVFGDALQAAFEPREG